MNRAGSDFSRNEIWPLDRKIKANFLPAATTDIALRGLR